jgi:polyisoprenoid-binding protein YceI
MTVIRGFSVSCVAALSLILSGCSAGTDLGPGVAVGGPPAGTAARGPGRADDRPSTSGAATAPAASAGELTPVPVADGKAILTPDNTSIGFVGTHTGLKPDPRTGGFALFTGNAEVDTAGKTLKSASVEIKTDSLWTQIPPLTGHLKSPDFFNTQKHPTARFVSKSIAPIPAQASDQFTITGDLTLLGTTKEVSFPAKVNIGDSGLTLSGSFTLDRTEFGMDRVQDKVQKGVTITLAIGKKTEPQTGGGPGFTGGGRPGGPGQANGKRPPAKD